MAVNFAPFETYKQSIFDDIVGFEDIKDYITLAFQSPDPQHLWFNGPPACAKSLLLEKLEEIGGRMIFGSKITKDGLIKILYEERPILLLIDEIEKVKDHNDLSPLLTWLQDGRVKRDTYKENDDYIIDSDKWMVFTASNSITRFKKKMPELLSRFSMFQIPEYKKNEFEIIVYNILNHKYNLERPIAENIALNLTQRNDYNVREAQRIAGLIKNSDNPYFSINTVFKIKDKYKIQ